MIGITRDEHSGPSNHSRHRSRPTRLLAFAVLTAVALPVSADIPRRGLQAVTPTVLPTQAARPAPEPGALGAGWWEFLDVGSPGMEERSAELLARATAASSTLPQAQSADAAAAIERLRVSLRTLPEMLKIRASGPAAQPAVAAVYTTTEFLRLDRRIRDIQTEIDERRSARDMSTRAVRDAQGRMDTHFAAYIGMAPSPARTLAGLQLMAERAQIAITEAEQRIRQAETDALTSELQGLQQVRVTALQRIVPDPDRSPEQLQTLIARTEDKLNDQRAEILRLQIQRTAAGGDSKRSAAETEYADQKIVAAMAEEGFLNARLSLFRTETDWLGVTTRQMTTMTASAVERRLAERTTDLNALEKSANEWLSATERSLAMSLRTPAAGLGGDQTRLREDRINLAQQTITRIDQLRSLLTDVRLGMDVTLQLLADYSGWRGWLWTRVLNPGVKLAGQADDWLGASIFKIGDTPVTTYGLLRIGFILLLAVVASRLIQYLLGRLSARDRNRSSAGLYAVGRLLHYLIVAAALLIGLASIGLDFSQLALVAGALSIGIGFGLQSVVNNFVSGLIILFERNLKIGDVVQIDANTTGVVREINVRSTLINTSDNVDIVVPNADFISGKVTNYTLRDPFHRIHVPFSVAYGTDKDLVRRVIIAAALKVPFTLASEKNRDPDVWLVRLGASALEFELVVWINPAAVSRPSAVVASYVWEVETALRENGIEIPLPGRDVRVRLDPASLRDALRERTGAG
jgi:small-conductance mechanosensitive channel